MANPFETGKKTTRRPRTDDAEKLSMWEPEMNTGCWLWTGAIASNGYGKLFSGGQTVSAHKFFYRSFKGDVPAGLSVCHRCDTRPCVNPSHLFLGTPADNSADAKSKGRLPQGERHHNRRLTEAAVRDIRAGGATPEEFAARYGVSRWLIVKILAGIGWADVGTPNPIGRLRGSSTHQAKLTEADIPNIRRERAAGSLMREIAVRYGVATVTIQQVLSGKAWAHVK